MTPETKDGRENYMPKPVTSKVQLNHIMLSTEVSKTLMIFWFFPGEEKPWETINRLRYRWKRLTYETGFANAKSESGSITLTHCTLPQAAAQSLQLSPASPRAGQGQGHPGPQGRALCSQSWERSRDAEQPLESCECSESSWPGCTGKFIW